MTRRATFALLGALLVAATTRGQEPATPPVLPEIPSASPSGLPSPSGLAAAPPGATAFAMDPPAGPPAGVVPDGPGTTGADARYWVNGEFLLGWISGTPLPAIVTTSPAGTPQTAAGVLGNPNTQVLFGSTQVNQGVRPGFRLGAGYFFDQNRIWGVEAGFFLLTAQGTNYFASSQGDPILARPFSDASSNAPLSVLVAYPGVSTGSIAASVASHALFGGNLDFSENLYRWGGFRLDALLGYRFVRFDERLIVNQSLTATGQGFVPGTTINSTDSFGTQNTFNGGDFGLRASYFGPQWSLGLLGKLAVGGVHREVDINGSQTVTVPGQAPVTQTGGVFALSSNIGHFGANDWTLLPEVGATVGYQITPNLRATIGYNLLFLFRVARPGGQIDNSINQNLLPPANQVGSLPANPAFTGERDDIWVQTLNLGLEWRY